MADRERALALVDVAERHATALEDVVPRVFSEYASDTRTRLATERALQVAIEALLDLGGLVVAERKLGLPTDESSVIDRLRASGQLADAEAELLRELRRFRNVLVHRYGSLDDRLVFQHALKAPADIRRLAGALGRAMGP